MLWLTQLAATRGHRWELGIGDPSVYGWATVAAYLLAALLCLVAWRSVPRVNPGRGRKRLRLFLAATALIMLALAVNKQLDLQTLITQTGKDLSRRQGWYAQRREVQRLFVFAVTGLGVVGVLVGMVILRGLWQRAGLVLLGLCVTLSFVVIRAASFHRVDHLIGTELAGVRINVILELTGITLVALGALMCRTRPNRPATQANPSTPAAA